ncbi:phage tail family protein [Enterococcus ureasiticus]|uniref:distal tail protein Dit n=1 Tax=Enterococcus ureasiticus TaxID=903984 RepID=UPI001A8CA71A|nr:distal tail protein Dit [Enterococcus ureasiticus]MBO0473238.1 phage tail family protein [Enterococcus ureasiticus]
MYTFEDTIKRKRKSDIPLPTSAMNYDGIWLEDAIEGYRTLNVTGREMISPEIQSENVNVGSIISSQRLPSRTLKITYQIKNDDPEMFLVNFRRLMEYLYREQAVPVYFNDEQDVLYYGRFSGSDEVPGDRYTVTASFDIYCADPRKYSLKFYRPKKVIRGRFSFKTRPSKIVVKIEKDASLTVTNGMQNVKVVNGKLSPDDEVVINFVDGTVMVNGINRTNWLDLSSDFENFELKNNQVLSCDNGVMTLYYREVSL